MVKVPATPAGMPAITHYRVDRDHGNTYEAWKRMGSPQPPTEAQFSTLALAGALATLGPPARMPVQRGQLRLSFSLPRQGVSLLTVTY